MKEPLLAKPSSQIRSAPTTMEEPPLASSPPSPDVDSAAATSSPPRYPAWVLLDKKAYFTDRENATTATATSWSGHEVKVTFCLEDPPAVSHFCVHGPEFNPQHFVDEPLVLSSEKDLVLLSFVFTDGPRSTALDRHHGEYFIYRAGRVNAKPSLTPIPATPPGMANSLCVSIVPCDDGDKGGFFLADLFGTTTLGQYDLSIYSSKTETWTSRTLELHSCSAQIRAVDLPIVPHKVILLGGGLVGWVDLWRGIIACNILEEEPFIYFIPLPKPNFNLPRIGDPKPVRDVICYNGVIKFVEMEHCFRQEVVRCSKRFKVTEDLDGVDRLYDSDILLLPQEDFLQAPGEQIIRIPDGWKIRTCYRHISWDHWRKGHSVHVDDIHVDDIHVGHILAHNPEHSVMLRQMLDGCGNSSLRNLTTAYPTLGLNGDDVVYLMSKVEFYDKNAWMVGVDLGNKTVEILEPYVAERASYFEPDCLPCAFSEFLNPTPRSCADKAAFASNEGPKRVVNDHLPSGCSGYADREAPGYIDINPQHQPPPSNWPQPLHLDLTSSGSGHAHPVNSQSMYPVLSPDAHGQLWLSVPLGENFLSQLLQLAARPFTPLMPQKSVSEVQQIGGPANVISTSLGMPYIKADAGLANVMPSPVGMTSIKADAGLANVMPSPVGMTSIKVDGGLANVMPRQLGKTCIEGGLANVMARQLGGTSIGGGLSNVMPRPLGIPAQGQILAQSIIPP